MGEDGATPERRAARDEEVGVAWLIESILLAKRRVCVRSIKTAPPIGQWEQWDEREWLISRHWDYGILIKSPSRRGKGGGGGGHCSSQQWPPTSLGITRLRGLVALFVCQAKANN